MKIIVYFLLSLFIVSCSSTRLQTVSKIEGKYQWEGGYGVGETLEIRSDSTFIFTWYQGLISGITLGKIERIENQLCLSSEFKGDSNGFELEIPPQTKLEYYEIMVNDTSRYKLKGASCSAYYDGKLINEQPANDLGICKIESVDMDSLVIRYIGLKDANLEINKSSTPKSMIVILKEENHYQAFEGQFLKQTRKNSVEFTSFGRKKTFKRI